MFRFKIIGRILLLLGMFGQLINVSAQATQTISGSIRDAETGEELIGAAIYPKANPGNGVVTNSYGFYSLTLPAGKQTIVAKYVGYKEQELEIDPAGNKQLNINLSAGSVELKQVEVTSKKSNENVKNAQMSATKLDIQELARIPVLFGEKDILKTLQLLPGVKGAGEGNSGFYVRGGSQDQNLILLDEAPVYNPSHLLGFFSTFNNDALKDATLYKGNMPAEFGGRLSSVLDIKMKEGNDKNYGVSGGIGLISSRLNVEGPIVKDQGSFIVTARRTYADVFLKLSKNPDLRKSTLYFYDINAKANYRIGKKDRVFLSGYFGRDNFGLADRFHVDYGNSTATVRWNHVFNDKLFSNTSFIYNNFGYKVGIGSGDLKLDIRSIINDYSLKEDLQYYLNAKNSFRFGMLTTMHTIVPGQITSNDTSRINNILLSKNYGWENAVYLQHEATLFKNKVNINYGVRLSTFSLAGPSTSYKFDGNGNTTDTIHQKLGTLGKTYFNFEPRFSLSYSFLENMSFKVAYSRNAQNLHLLSNATTTSPTDRWILTSNNVKPEIADQVSAGYFFNFYKNMFEVSVEGYYKHLWNQIDYKGGAQLRANETVESQLVYGTGRAYGGEFFIKKRTGKFTGWISYTLSRTERTFATIDNGKYFPAKQDRTHDLSVVLMYDITPRLNISATWVYYTGNAVTFAQGKYLIDGSIQNYYGNRNSSRMPAYHRLDFGLTYKLKKRKNWEHDLNVSVYNLYARKNAYQIEFVVTDQAKNITEAQKTYLFRIVPSITYNFRFTALKKEKKIVTP